MTDELSQQTEIELNNLKIHAQISWFIYLFLLSAKMHITDDLKLASQLTAAPEEHRDRRAPEDVSTNPHNRMQSSKDHDTVLEKILVCLSILFVILFPISLPCIFVVVRQFERILILRNGKIYQDRAFGPGLICHLPCVDTIKYIDLRLVCYALPPQECITKDSLTVTIQSIIYYRVYDPLSAINNVADYKLSTQILASTTLRNAVSTQKLQELLLSKSAVSVYVMQHMKRLTREWGIYIERTEIKDIYLPLQLQTAMAVEAESSRLANAKIIVSKAEIESTKSLQKATTILMDNPLCMQLRFLQSLHMIAGEKTHTIVFPYSADMVKNVLGGNSH